MRDEWEGFVAGVVKSATKVLFDIIVTVEVTKDYNNKILFQVDFNVNHAVFKSRKSPQNLVETSLATLQYMNRNQSTSPTDLKISVPALCSAFPFLVIFDGSLQIQQLGSSLARLLGPFLSAQEKDFSKYFELLDPKVQLTFPSILGRKNGSFLLRVKFGNEDSVSPDAVELRGQMIHLPESNCTLFLGSPRVESIDELQGSALFLSDIPLHDVTRSLFLLSEQAVVQDGLKKSMEQLKNRASKSPTRTSTWKMQNRRPSWVNFSARCGQETDSQEDSSRKVHRRRHHLVQWHRWVYFNLWQMCSNGRCKHAREFVYRIWQKMWAAGAK